MADHGIVILNKTASTDVGSYNCSVVAGSSVDIDNGNVFVLGALSTATGYSEVFSFSKNAGSSLNLWMAYSPEAVVTTSGNYKFKNIDKDARNFYNSGSYVFDAFKPQVGDIITITAAGISGSPSTGAYLNAADNSYVLTFAASQGSYHSWKLLAETYVSIGTGGLGDTQRVLAYKIQCVAN